MIYEKLLHNVPQLNSTILPLVIDDDPEISAWTNYRSVHITTGFLDFVESDDEIAFVLAHEIGHVYDRFVNGYHWKPVEGEERADMLGIAISNAAGYKGCAGAEFFFRLFNTYGDHYPGSHPQPTDRMIYLACHDVLKLRADQ